jgi:hypothetical protein
MIPRSSIGSRSSASSSSQSLQEEIARTAYQLFVDRGYEHGHDREDWFRAEQIVSQRRASRN